MSGVAGGGNGNTRNSWQRLSSWAIFCDLVAKARGDLFRVINTLDLDHPKAHLLDLMFEPGDRDAVFVGGGFEVQAVAALAADDMAPARCRHCAQCAFLFLGNGAELLRFNPATTIQSANESVDFLLNHGRTAAALSRLRKE